ncbi:MAG: fructokinase [Gammaproteobacteria bacterium]|jgi:fructokinase
MRIGIDLGGTKIEGIVLDNSSEIRARQRVSTPRGDYAAILATITDLVVNLESEVGRACSVGIGMPGTISPYNRRVKNSNTTVLNGKAFDRDLTIRMGRELRFENDANCFVLSESVDGAGRDSASVFGVILGTGTGGGISINQQILRGANAIAGEWGHNPLPWARAGESAAPECYCGKTGCIETYVSGAGLTFAYSEQEQEVTPASEIAVRAEAGEPAAQSAIALYADRLARGLASIVNVIDPDIVVLGGGLSKITVLYRLLPPLVEKYAFTDRLTLRVVPATHGDSSGVRGAAWLWPIKPSC